MFNFIKKAPNSSPKWFVRYMACQHPLGFLQSFLPVDSRAIYSKHNLDPITFLLKPFQWFSTVLRMESTFLETACIAGPLACISYCFLSPCPLVSAFQSLSLWSFFPLLFLDDPCSPTGPSAYLSFKFQLMAYFLRGFLWRRGQVTCYLFLSCPGLLLLNIHCAVVIFKLRICLSIFE